MTPFETWSVALQIALSVIGILTLYVFYRQFRVMSDQLSAMRDSTRAQSALALVAFIQSPEVRAARHIVRAELSKKMMKEWTEDERRNASLVVANYDVAAALLRAGLVPVELITDNWGPSITHCHQILAPYMEEQRNRAGGSKDYWTNFEWLNAQALLTKTGKSENGRGASSH